MLQSGSLVLVTTGSLDDDEEHELVVEQSSPFWDWGTTTESNVGSSVLSRDLLPFLVPFEIPLIPARGKNSDFTNPWLS